VTSQDKTILLVAGEASGDLWGSLLVQAFQAIDPQIKFFGIGLEKMEASGVELLLPPEAMIRLSLVGSLENIGKIPALLRLRRDIVHAVKEKKPVAAILIDFPGFNLSLARKIKKLGLPLFYYPPPQVWLWGKWRLRKLRKWFKQLLVFFPFEERFYRDAGVPAQWVGHPVLSWIHGTARPDRDPLQIALLPGSRFGSIRYQLPPMLDAARLLHRANPSRRFVIPLAPSIPKAWMAAQLKGSESFVKILETPAHLLLQSSGLAIVGVGTAALEAAFCGTPLVSCGKFSRSTYWIGRFLLRIHPEVIVNRLAGKPVAKEFWQYQVTGANLAREAEALLGDEHRYRETVAELEKIKEIFLSKRDASREAARTIYDSLTV
jgi:lipid-A-disaccharide synthase